MLRGNLGRTFHVAQTRSKQYIAFKGGFRDAAIRLRPAWPSPH
jgi:hypothetical protein